jgi:hypothetical protein
MTYDALKEWAIEWRIPILCLVFWLQGFTMGRMPHDR